MRKPNDKAGCFGQKERDVTVCLTISMTGQYHHNAVQGGLNMKTRRLELTYIICDEAPALHIAVSLKDRIYLIKLSRTEAPWL